MTNDKKDEFLEYIKKTPLPTLLRVLYTEYLASIQFIQMMGLEEDFNEFSKERKAESEYPTYIEGGTPREIAHEFVEKVKRNPDWNKTEN